jgi:hypothetical protein
MVTGIKPDYQEGKHGMVGTYRLLVILSTLWAVEVHHLHPGLDFPVKADNPVMTRIVVADNPEIVEREEGDPPLPPLRSPHSISTYKNMTWFRA